MRGAGERRCARGWKRCGPRRMVEAERGRGHVLDRAPRANGALGGQRRERRRSTRRRRARVTSDKAAQALTRPAHRSARHIRPLGRNLRGKALQSADRETGLCFDLRRRGSCHAARRQRGRGGVPTWIVPRGSPPARSRRRGLTTAPPHPLLARRSSPRHAHGGRGGRRPHIPHGSDRRGQRRDDRTERHRWWSFRSAGSRRCAVPPRPTRAAAVP